MTVFQFITKHNKCASKCNAVIIKRAEKIIYGDSIKNLLTNRKKLNGNILSSDILSFRLMEVDNNDPTGLNVIPTSVPLYNGDLVYELEV
jgi:hypothetical protein